MNVYDFDNTIYEGESGVDLFLGYLKKEPRLLAKLPMAIKCIFQYKTGFLHRSSNHNENR